MNVLIIEDEAPAAEKLERYLHKYSPDIKVLDRLISVKDATAWLQNRQDELSLIFMDIQLTDGLSFQIFQQIDINKPVIFTTAFSEFALDAFKVNSIDYLLKPITFTDLSNSLKKLESLRTQLGWQQSNAEQLKHSINKLSQPVYKERFMVKVGDHIKSITTTQTTLFFADGRDVYLVTDQNRKFIIDFTLETLEEVLDPAIFFRINRTFIINIHFIKDVMVYSSSRLKISLTQDFDKEMIVSREKVAAFKEWFGGERI